MEITPSLVNSIDEKYPTPLQDYNTILEKLKELFPNMDARRIANFSSHFLTGFFDHGSKEWKMANALMANVYYYHYVALMNLSSDAEGDGHHSQVSDNQVIDNLKENAEHQR